MTLLLWLGVIVAGLLLALGSARGAVTCATRLALSFGLSPFLVGATVLAVGTDLPEIANSIASCLAGHGDLNLGDSIGSSLTQATLILGVLPFLGAPMVVGGRRVGVIGGLTLLSLAIGALLASDGDLSRLDGLLLVVLCPSTAWLVHRYGPPAPIVADDSGLQAGRAEWSLALPIVAYLTALGVGSTVAVFGFIRLSALLEAPEFLVSFFLASLGTSLPELVIDVTALRRRRSDLAIGNVLGSSLLDATLSIGIGPLLAPVTVSAGLALRGYAGAMGGIAIVTLLLTLRARHDRQTGLILIVLYVGAYWILLTGA